VLFLTQTAEWTWVNPIVQLVTAGGFGALVWFLIVKYIPNQEERHKEERTTWQERHKEERNQWTSMIADRDQSFSEQLNKFTEIITKVEMLLERVDTKL